MNLTFCGEKREISNLYVWTYYIVECLYFAVFL